MAMMIGRSSDCQIDLDKFIFLTLFISLSSSVPFYLPTLMHDSLYRVYSPIGFILRLGSVSINYPPPLAFTVHIIDRLITGTWYPISLHSMKPYTLDTNAIICLIC